MQVDIRPGAVYFLKGDEGRSKALLKDLMTDGRKMIYVSDSPSNQVHADEGLPIELTITLTDAVGKGCIEPQNLTMLADAIIKFVENTPRSVIVIKCLAKLKEKNDFPRMLKLVGLIREMAAVNRAIAVIVFDTTSFSNVEMAFLAKEGTMIDDRDRFDLPEGNA